MDPSLQAAQTPSSKLPEILPRKRGSFSELVAPMKNLNRTVQTLKTEISIEFPLVKEALQQPRGDFSDDERQGGESDDQRTFSMLSIV